MISLCELLTCLLMLKYALQPMKASKANTGTRSVSHILEVTLGSQAPDVTGHSTYSTVSTILLVIGMSMQP